MFTNEGMRAVSERRASTVERAYATATIRSARRRRGNRYAKRERRRCRRKAQLSERWESDVDAYMMLSDGL